MPIPANQIVNAEVIINGVVASAGSSAKKMQAVFHYRRTATVVTPTKAALETAFASAIRVLFINCLSVRLSLSTITVRWLNDAIDAPLAFATAGAGAIIGDSMPLTNAVYLLFQTGLRGKSYRGSKHLFPIGESATTVLTDDILNAAALTYFGLLSAALLAQITDSTGNVWVPSVVSKKLSQLKVNPTTVVANDVISIAVAKRIGTMRHRRVAQLY